jgi:aminobenzoyl-glutamate utilization protein B
MSLKDSALSHLHTHEENLVEVAKAIWEHPEVGLQEHFASTHIAAELEQAGFTLQKGVGQMPTAFVASWGNGKPIIGILGEYDALPGLSQTVTANKEAIVDGGPGHGCGHNLFGVASLGAALAVKQAMEQQRINGTIRYYGCPAEETLVGKTFMARDGVFDDLDAALAWHPSSINSVWNSSSLAMNSFKVNFYGVASHAAAAPEMGRSALDAAQLMDIGVNYLREHVPQETRMHSVITHGGGAPNVVPPHAQIWWFVRAPRREQVDAVYQRVLDIAKGAALMTGTTYDIDFLTGCYEMLANQALSNLMLEKMKELGGIRFNETEKVFAKQLQASIPAHMFEAGLAHLLQNAASGTTRADLGDALCEGIIMPSESPRVMSGSTEVGDVSQIAPTANLVTACEPLGTPPHSWQTVATSGSSIGFRGMMFAAQVLSLTALDLLTKPEALKAARDEFMQATQGKKYVTPLPADAKPH